MLAIHLPSRDGDLAARQRTEQVLWLGRRSTFPAPGRTRVVDLAPMKFSELDLHPALQGALAARGYETATSVQTAVLERRARDRDLMVSSQTGSGKTIAFGAAVVQTLLGAGPAAAGAGGDAGDEGEPSVAAGAAAAPPSAQAYVPGGKRPGALVVVPTRELAVQVREELGWFLAQTRLRLGSFTGGTAVTGDLRALQRGVDVAIGTPGRLVDLVTRERLDLSGLRAVVLDEADEMLDLGFREDLETLLKASPPERRTLLLSATLPTEIRSMARKYQRDALAIDPRKDGGESPTSPHADIHYVAHLISGHDRLATVVNVLRARAPRRAIVFCTTRDAVSSLHAALVARGFAATAISGERAQADRDRALGLIRSGQAQVLVATNVAARGLHLPDVDLIVHADLPLNAESLTHRSGRTGRAGRKGTAVVIATLAERRKAERLMALAHVVAPWAAAPTPDSITAAARERLVESLLGAQNVDVDVDADGGGLEGGVDGDGGGPPVDGEDQVASSPDLALRADIAPMLARLEAKLDGREIVSRLLARELERLPRGEPVHAVSTPDDREGRGRVSEDRGDRARFDAGSSVMFRLNMGAKDKADPKWILPLICSRGRVTRREVGAIRVEARETTFEIAAGAAANFARAAAETDPRAPQIRFERVPFSGRPQPRRPSATFQPLSATAEKRRSPARFEAVVRTDSPPAEPVRKVADPLPQARPAARGASVKEAGSIPQAAPLAPRHDAEPRPGPVLTPPAAVSTPLAVSAPTNSTAPIPETGAPIDTGPRTKRGVSTLVIERKHTPLRGRDATSTSNPKSKSNSSTPTSASTSARGGSPSGPPPEAASLRAPGAGKADPAHPAGPGAGSPLAARSQGGFGPPRRFVAHAQPGRGPADRESATASAPAEKMRASSKDGGARGQRFESIGSSTTAGGFEKKFEAGRPKHPSKGGGFRTAGHGPGSSAFREARAGAGAIRPRPAGAGPRTERVKSKHPPRK